jgi:ABC-type Zn uptake system ZnuABC Zn-binding protein ZnuA
MTARCFPRSRAVLLAAVALAVPLFAPGCGSDSTWPDRPGPKVVVSFPPIFCFAVNVAGEDAVVKNMMSTVGPHSFQPTDTDARLLRHADLFLVNGIGLDNALADSLKAGSGNRKLKVVALGERIPADRLVEGRCNHEHGHAHDHDHGHDPHVWLGPDHAIVMVEAIRDELKAADPAHAANYDRRAAEYVAKLRKLKEDGLAVLKDKADRKLVTFHESLAYFAGAYNLSVEGVVQKKPGLEPNADELKALIKTCAEKKVRLIAVEPQYTANTSARAVLYELKRNGVEGADLVEIDPLETVRPDDLTPDWYERKMRANLEALAKAMK